MLDAGKLLGTVAPSPLLVKWISNRRTEYDFIFYTRDNFAMALDLARELFETRPHTA
jgi:hypothetical protein